MTSARAAQIEEIARAFVAQAQGRRGAFEAGAGELARAIRLSGADPGRPVVCLAHVQPDADALGAALGLAFAVRAAGGTSLVAFDPGPLPFAMPPALAFLPGEQLLTAADALPTAPALAVVCDTGSAERLGRLQGYATRVPTLVLDHHAQGTAFGDHRIVVPTAAATCEIVADLLTELGLEPDRDIATCLYAGLAADTGSFRYASTSPETHRLAARLVTAGARPDLVSTALFDTRPAAYLTVLTAALTRVRRDGDLIWTQVTAADLAGAGATAEEAEGVIDVIRVVPDHDVALVLKADGEAPGRWKVSVRSRGATDVGAVCAELRGGGHRLAAGFSAAGEPEQVVVRFRRAMRTVARRGA